MSFGIFPNCGHELSAGDIVWLREDCGLDCDDCHADNLREDPSDLNDHGSPYRLTSQLGECIVLASLTKEAA